ncbi:MAG: hypothetical protein JWN52_2749 [Actinomycetia bacterium]|nr:hypothetical protein [Actinomycetes bacterium]
MGPLRRVLPAATVLLLAACSSSHHATRAAKVAAPPMRLVAYGGCPELLTGLRAAAEKQVGPYGLPGDSVGFMARGAATAKIAEAPEPQYSGTNVHEAGVDEPDLVKTDGRRIVVLARGALQVIDPATKKVTSRLKLPGLSFGGPRGPFIGGSSGGDLLLSGDRALIITREFSRRIVPGTAESRPMGSPRLRLIVVDLAAEPRVTGTLTVDGNYLDARQVGSVARIVVRSSPQIDFPQPRFGPGQKWDEKQLTETNRQVVRQAPLEAWLPTYEVESGGSRQTHQVPCERVSHPADSTGTSMLSVLTIDLAKNLGDPDPVSVVADGNTVYGTGSSLYVADTSAWRGSIQRPGQRTDVQPDVHTDLHKFDVSGAGRPRYVASGSVPGDLLNQYSLSEFGGNLRVATTSGQKKTQSAVYVLAQNGPRLDTVGNVTGLGKGERIYSVRFLGATAYVVTFRQVDPLYTLDLRDPRKPAVTGELKISGYSSYLHPTADGRLIGVGQDADLKGRTQGTQVSLFDVTGEPKRLAGFQLPGTHSNAEYDPHAFLYWPQSGLTVLPVWHQNGSPNEVLVLTVTAQGIHKLGTVRHPGGDYPPPIQRSLLVGTTLWTISDAGARANDATTLAPQSWLPFPTS